MDTKESLCKSVLVRVRWFESSPAHFPHPQLLTRVREGEVDAPHYGMKPGGDKMVTNSSLGVQQPSKKRRKGKRGKPHASVKFGSAVVPIYKTQSGARTRYTISYHRDGQRVRQVFASL